MPLPTPILDDRSYQQLRDELVRRIPVYAPEWTDHNASDPGITLIELFAYLGETLLYRFNQIPESAKLEFLRLLQLPLRAATSATGLVVLTTEEPAGVLAETGKEVKAGKVSFETRTEVVAWPLEVRGVARLAGVAPSTEEALVFTQNALDAITARAAKNGTTLSAGSLNPVYYTTQILPTEPAAPGVTAVDLATTVDSALWVAVLKTDKTEFDALYDGVINIGYQPDTVVQSMAEVEPAPGAGSTTPSPPVVWQISTGKTSTLGDPQYKELIPVGDTTAGLTKPGVVRLRLPKEASSFGAFTLEDEDLAGTGDLPPTLEDEELAGDLLFWLRAFRSDGSLLGRALWVGINVAQVEQTRTARPEYLGTGNAQPDQSFRLINKQVVPGSIVLEVEGVDGWSRWTEVDSFHASKESDRHYSVDAEAGEVRFGNGVQGLAPQIGERIRASSYRYGGGVAGNVAADSIDKITGVSKVKVANPLPMTGGEDAESVEDALKRIPGEFRRHDRAVAASDFQELALATPGVDVGRAEVLPLFHPQNPTIEAAGVVSVVVWPASDPKNPDSPTPDTNMLSAVCRWLDERRLVTTELYVIPPTYKKIAVAIGLEAEDGYGIEAVRRWVELAIRQYLAPLPPYGPSGGGWPLGRRVYGPEIEAAALQVEGVDFLRQVNLAVYNETTGVWEPVTAVGSTDACAPQSIELQPWEVPYLTEMTVVKGDPLAAGAQTTPPSSGTPVPIPTLKEEC